MKNLHYLKKFVVMVLAAMMTLSTFAMPTFAAKGSVTIEGLEAGLTPTAYKIADVVKNGDGDSVKRIKDAQGKDIIGESQVKDLYNPTTNEIMKLASNMPEGITPINGEATTGETATLANLDPGIYLVKFAATGTVKNIYNPVIVSVKNDGTMVVGDLNSYKDTTKAKKSKVEFDKVVERTEGKLPADQGANADNDKTQNDELGGDAVVHKFDADGNRGDTAGKESVVTYRINATVPQYGDNYFSDFEGNAGIDNFKAPQFKIYDTLDGLTLNTKSIKVYANGIELTENTDYTLVPKMNGDKAIGFEIALEEAAIKDARGKTIEVRYSAKVNVNPDRVNFNPDTNTAYCEYSNNPNSDTVANTGNRTTYHYKFTINGKIEGNKGKENREVLKVGINSSTGDHIYVEQSTGVVDLEGWTALEGVLFDLYDNEAGTGDPVRAEVKSDENGILRGMDELDAGTYWLKERQTQPTFTGDGKYAANGYKPNTNAIQLEIEAKLIDDGRLDSYIVKVTGTVVGNYKAKYTDTSYTGAEGTKDKDVRGSFVEFDGDKVGDGNEITEATTIKKQHNVTAGGNVVGKDDNMAAEILNTKVGTLPSTGGMGTVLFTIGGVAIMALALFLLFGGKKKQHQK